MWLIIRTPFNFLIITYVNNKKIILLLFINVYSLINSLLMFIDSILFTGSLNKL